jgi:hypothetical protein
MRSQPTKPSLGGGFLLPASILPVDVCEPKQAKGAAPETRGVGGGQPSRMQQLDRGRGATRLLHLQGCSSFETKSGHRDEVGSRHARSGSPPCHSRTAGGVLLRQADTSQEQVERVARVGRDWHSNRKLDANGPPLFARGGPWAHSKSTKFESPAAAGR